MWWENPCRVLTSQACPGEVSTGQVMQKCHISFVSSLYVTPCVCFNVLGRSAMSPGLESSVHRRWKHSYGTGTPGYKYWCWPLLSWPPWLSYNLSRPPFLIIRVPISPGLLWTFNESTNTGCIDQGYYSPREKGEWIKKSSFCLPSWVVHW